MSTKSYQLDLSLADQLRLEKLAQESGESKEALIVKLIHDFFRRKGVKNPIAKAG